MDNQQTPAVFLSRPVRILIRRNNTGPGLHQCRFHVSGAVLDGDQVTPFIALQNFLCHQPILRHTTVELIAIRQILVLVVDVRLNDKPLTDLELPFDVVAHSHNGQCDFMAHDHWLRVHIAPSETWMLRTKINYLYVRKTDATRVMAHQKLIRPKIRQ